MSARSCQRVRMDVTVMVLLFHLNAQIRGKGNTGMLNRTELITSAGNLFIINVLFMKPNRCCVSV